MNTLSIDQEPQMVVLCPAACGIGTVIRPRVPAVAAGARHAVDHVAPPSRLSSTSEAECAQGGLSW